MLIIRPRQRVTSPIHRLIDEAVNTIKQGNVIERRLGLRTLREISVVQILSVAIVEFLVQTAEMDEDPECVLLARQLIK